VWRNKLVRPCKAQCLEESEVKNELAYNERAKVSSVKYVMPFPGIDFIGNAKKQQN